jgi:hypothetical protein
MKLDYRFLKFSLIFFWMLQMGSCNSKALTIGNETMPYTVPSIIGEWIVTETTKSPLSIVLLCKPIQKGTTFKFTQNTLEIYLDASGGPCDVYSYRISNNTISFIKKDMVFFCNYELNSRGLKIISDSFFTPIESDKSVRMNNSPTTAQEVAVLLKKLK